MSIDVFIRFAPRNPVRTYIAAAVWARWKLEKDVNLHGLWMSGCDILTSCPNHFSVAHAFPEKDFCWTTREYAAKHAKGEYYILADDDHLILGDEWAKRAIRGVKPGYGILSARSVVRGEYVDDPNRRGGGCPCIIRKGLGIDFSKLYGVKPCYQDPTIEDELLKNQLMQGYIPGLDYLHAGFGLSQVEPRCWLTY